METPETVTLTVRPGAGYGVGAPASASVTITSEDVAADLTVTSITVPARAAPGATIAVGDTTRNQGSGAAAASITRFFLSKDALLDAADLVLESRAVEPLAVGAASTGTTAVALPSSLVAGSYFVFAKADAQHQIVELNEANNTRPATLKIGPDLVVSALSAPLRAAPGATLTIGDTTRNDGPGTAGASVTAFYLSANFLLDTGDVRLAQTRTVPALAEGVSSSGTTAVTLPAIAPGTWFLIASADDQAAVAETAESNNVRFASIQIGPDLTFQSVTVPATAAPGATINVSTVVRNSGGAVGSLGDQVLPVGQHHARCRRRRAGGDAVGARIAPAMFAGATTPVALPPGITGRSICWWSPMADSRWPKATRRTTSPRGRSDATLPMRP